MNQRVNIQAQTIRGALGAGIIYTLVFAVVFLLFTWESSSATAIFNALPFALVLYFIFFTVGRPVIGDWMRLKTRNDARYLFLFSLFLTGLFYSYLAINGVNPLKGTLFLVPYLLFFPVLAFATRGNANGAIGWFDFTVFFLFFFPVTLVSVRPAGSLPFTGDDIDSAYRIIVMLSAIFAFSVVRNLRDIGAYPIFNWKYLFTTIWVWLAFYVFVFIIGYAVNFIKPTGIPALDLAFMKKIGIKVVAVFFHTALFEELVFRGLLQNMLHKRISQSRSWKIFWRYGLTILLILALITGYTMKGNMQYFPALITGCLFIAAFLMEKTGRHAAGSYTALAITSVLFGLVHFHTGSIIFTALAAIGGWAYGYVYMKTKNIFYAALLHTLVNSSALIFGLALAK